MTGKGRDCLGSYSAVSCADDEAAQRCLVCCDSWVHTGEGLCCAVLFCAKLCCAVLCYAVLFCSVLCCAVLCYAVLFCAILCCSVLYCAVLCGDMLCCAVLCYAVLCGAMLCSAVWCYAVRCCAVWCYSELCCAVLSRLLRLVGPHWRGSVLSEFETDRHGYTQRY